MCFRFILCSLFFLLSFGCSSVEMHSEVLVQSSDLTGADFRDLDVGGGSVVIRTSRNLYHVESENYLLPPRSAWPSAFSMLGKYPVYLVGEKLYMLKEGKSQPVVEVPLKGVMFASNEKYIYLTGIPKKGNPTMFVISPGQGFQQLFDLPRRIDTMSVVRDTVFYSIGPTIFSFAPDKKLTVFAVLPGFKKITSLTVDPDHGIIYVSDDHSIYAMVLSRRTFVLLLRAPGGRVLYYGKNLYVLTRNPGALYCLKGLSEILLKDHPRVVELVSLNSAN